MTILEVVGAVGIFSFAVLALAAGLMFQDHASRDSAEWMEAAAVLDSELEALRALGPAGAAAREGTRPPEPAQVPEGPGVRRSALRDAEVTVERWTDPGLTGAEGAGEVVAYRVTVRWNGPRSGAARATSAVTWLAAEVAR